MAEADVGRWLANLQDELDSAELYRRIADAEEDEALSSVYRRLASRTSSPRAAHGRGSGR